MKHILCVSTLLKSLSLATPSVCVCKPLPEEGEEGEGGGVERGTREVDSPPVEIEAEERVEIFAARQKLSEYFVRTVYIIFISMNSFFTTYLLQLIFL